MVRNLGVFVFISGCNISQSRFRAYGVYPYCVRVVEAKLISDFSNTKPLCTGKMVSRFAAWLYVCLQKYRPTCATRNFMDWDCMSDFASVGANKRIQHEAIMASAGSGKTYVLTTRYIRLLDTFGQPERIIALTFTRAAAGEFFERIVNRLSAASASETAAAQLSVEIETSHDAAHYRALLRTLLQSLHRLNLQTLDSFFFRLASSFALELGMSGQMRLLDEADAMRAHERVLREMLDRPPAARRDAPLTAGTIGDFANTYKQATYGEENRTVRKTVADYVERMLPLYRSCRQADCWGEPATFWGASFPWQTVAVPFDQLADDLLALCPSSLGAQQRKAFEKLASQLCDYPVTRSVKFNTLFQRMLDVWPELRAGSAVLVSGRGKNSQITVTEQLAAKMDTILTAVIADQLHFRIQSTRATHAILERYDDCYDRLVRGNGLLAFDDVVDLLIQPGSVAPHLSAVDPEEARMWLDYRMDGYVDHWLFDEFQDTSRRQWSVVENLVDEVMQDTSGCRSLFYVGDTKQCLYLWRQSDDRLFHEIHDHYTDADGNGLALRSLPHSWRSAPAILDLVNRIFGDAGAIAEHFGDAVAARWQKGWNEHSAAGDISARSGAIYYTGKENANDDEDPFAKIATTLQELRPLDRGLSVGILVRTNADALKLTHYLKSECGLPAATSASAIPATDNPAGLALCAVIALAAHPGDRFAHGHLASVEAALNAADKRPLRHLAEKVRRQFSIKGSEATVQLIVDQLREWLPEDAAFLQSRLELLLEAARLYAAEAEVSLDGLLSALRSYKRDSGSAEKVIVVETIHHAKGLEYDVVFYYERETRSVHGRVPETMIQRDQAGRPNWLLKSPPRIVCDADPQLAGLLKDAEEQSGYAALCGLYVCLTRARRALYIIHSGKRSEGKSLSHFIADRLQGEGCDDDPDGWSYVHGQTDWMDSFPLIESNESGLAEDSRVADSLRQSPSPPIVGRKRLQSVRPSDAEDGGPVTSVAGLLRLGQSAIAFGSAVHAVFEAIEVWPSAMAEQQALIHFLRAEYLPEAVETVVRNLQNDAIASLFKAQKNQQIGRELPFAWASEGKLHRGVFDRLLIQLDNGGQVFSAHIVDFKTDRIGKSPLANAAAKHHHQLTIYRSALAAILGLNPEAIRTSLVFTEVASVVNML
jgi:ATP-dependent helicase/nuclease subunit A